MGLLEQKPEYARYYGGFRGVDFSSDHTQVNESRLAYSVNMYKDYQSGQGQSLESICGFRRRVATPEGKSIFGIHNFVEEGKTKILVHSGTKLYNWHNYPSTIGVVVKEGYVLGEVVDTIQTMNVFEIKLKDAAESIVKVETSFNTDVTATSSYDPETQILTVRSTLLIKGDTITVHFIEGSFKDEDILFTDMNEQKSTSFIFNNRLYIIDGKNYIVYDGEKVEKVSAGAYVPTTYINIIPAGENSDNGTEYEQRNILSPYFKHTFIADGETTKFYLNDNDLEEITEVKVYGKVVTDYKADLAGGTVTFTTAPKKPEEAVQVEAEGDGEDIMYPEFFAGIEITAKKSITAVSGIIDETVEIENIITACTIATIFDNRVFLSGNPKYPNHVFYCGRNTTGYVDPTYFGVLNYMQDGVGETAITGMIPVADSLMVLKGDTQQDGSVFFHTPTTTGDHIQPVIYPSTQGLAGTGCLGACVNFLDDPVFISRLGVEGIGQLSVRYERAIEHRSSLIDSKLVNLDLTKASLAEWNGYLLVSVNGKVFMADSRQRYTNESGTPQYEWYYLEDIGVYEGQYPEYKYTKEQYDYLEGKTVKICANCLGPIENCSCEKEIEIPIVVASEVLNENTGKVEDLRGLTANPPLDDGSESCKVFFDTVHVQFDEENEGDIGIYYVVHKIYDIFTGEEKGYEALLCESGKGAHTGGVFKPATLFKSIDYNLFFGTENGDVCSFNFDKRGEDGDIAPIWYSFNERAILSGCATKMDNCGIPHLTKTTIKKSTVIKTKAFHKSAAKIKVRTNKKAYSQIARINSSVFSFDDMDFSDFSFNTEGQTLYAVKEKEKKWVEKQYYIFSDEYQRPFALYYISYRYKIAGRYKE
ncbi:MAG: hypothetical protein IKB02_09960 [Clostridia bacterium]|nr:hypothetical protein [Clostridia bacterium]MBR2389058.1 hypothetical protein [Clostridia bacterium]